MRIRPLVRGAPQNFAAVVRGITPNTLVRDLKLQIIANPSLLPTVSGKAPGDLQLYFSPVFITPDVLLGRKQRAVMQPGDTLANCQVVNDDIIYLEYIKGA